MKRVLVCAWAALVLVGGFFGHAASTADAQPICAEGELVAGQCEVVGRPPLRGASTCPTEPDIVQAGCYRVEAPGPSGQCESGFWQIGEECRRSVQLIPGGLVCPDAGFVVVGDRCIGVLPPTCGPLGCDGEIALAYTVECVGDGVAQVQLGQPKLTNGATVSLITVNGSPTVGAKLVGGSAVLVVVTPARLNDTVSVTGPSSAPACTATAPPATAPPATPTSAPATPTSAPILVTPPAASADQQIPTPTAPAPTATVAAIPVVGSISNYGVGECDAEGQRALRLTASVEPSSAIDAIQLLIDGQVVAERSSPGQQTIDVVADGHVHVVELVVVVPDRSEGDMLVLDFPLCPPEAAPVQQTAAPTVSPGCPQGELLIDDRCVPRCSEFQTPDIDDCYALQRAGVTNEAPASESAAPVAVDDDDDLPLVPLAAIGGAMVVLASAVYAALSRSRTPTV